MIWIELPVLIIPIAIVVWSYVVITYSGWGS